VFNPLCCISDSALSGVNHNKCNILPYGINYRHSRQMYIKEDNYQENKYQDIGKINETVYFVNPGSSREYYLLYIFMKPFVLCL